MAFAVFFLLVRIFIGMAIGAFTGLLVSLITRCGVRALWKDGLLGSVGYVVGFIGCIFMPWPRNTITYQMEGGTTVTSTMNMYQHPERVAVLVAILLPLLNELYRWKRRRAARTGMA